VGHFSSHSNVLPGYRRPLCTFAVLCRVLPNRIPSFYHLFPSLTTLVYIADFINKIKTILLFEKLRHEVATGALRRLWKDCRKLGENSDFSVPRSFAKTTLSFTDEAEPRGNQCLPLRPPSCRKYGRLFLIGAGLGGVVGGVASFLR